MSFKRGANEAIVNTGNGALAGVKVLDFGWALVGSLTSKHLADNGAKVVRIESATHLALERTNRHVSISQATSPDDKPWFTHLNTSKYDMTLNLKHPRARGIIDSLIRWADVVNENFTPGTLNKLGFDYQYMRQIKADIIMLSASAFGQTGPMACEWGLDSTGNSLSGRNSLAGWPDRAPANPCSVAYGDDLLPLTNGLAVVAALDYKRRTGKGQHIDGSMIEVLAQQITPAFLDWQANSHLQTRDGNRIPNAAPHGVFPCQGDDRWCAIAVFTDEEWKAFCHVIGDPPWTKDIRFATLQSRKEQEDELEKLVAEWTMQHLPEEVMQMMQAGGVAAGVVQNAEDLVEHDLQLKKREFLVPLEHPVLGVFGHPTPPYKLLKTKAQIRTSPCLGEHTYYVCSEILNMSNEEFVNLEQDGVFS